MYVRILVVITITQPAMVMVVLITLLGVVTTMATIIMAAGVAIIIGVLTTTGVIMLGIVQLATLGIDQWAGALDIETTELTVDGGTEDGHIEVGLIIAAGVIMQATIDKNNNSLIHSVKTNWVLDKENPVFLMENNMDKRRNCFSSEYIHKPNYPLSTINFSKVAL
jgi:hypothetical protein